MQGMFIAVRGAADAARVAHTQWIIGASYCRDGEKPEHLRRTLRPRKSAVLFGYLRCSEFLETHGIHDLFPGGAPTHVTLPMACNLENLSTLGTSSFGLVELGGQSSSWPLYPVKHFLAYLLSPLVYFCAQIAKKLPLDRSHSQHRSLGKIATLHFLKPRGPRLTQIRLFKLMVYVEVDVVFFKKNIGSICLPEHALLSELTSMSLSLTLMLIRFWILAYTAGSVELGIKGL
ncbi:uncharacterized protein FOMMEDRAFT_160003 [Fomitiporia mediterranea MF3/22]|uniref:uncharacterized protein n=1 Tax=Fomitiporia mediterranea (strain MF3/22) TaxID=694068 RepID=UPI0004408F34|nr:uncharacterized protein FOMMEDRAFT_160003 [Fomitiporia mediterranea MF3/22]EJC99582.1 hypothetical protein FOMMEDRAFT_160003 [Fomitiporia mediterranea MF3/22]